MINKYTRAILVFVITSLITTACGSDTNEYVSGKDIIDSALEETEQRVMDNRETLKEGFDKHYRDGLYLEDFGELPDELNKKMTPLIQEKYDSLEGLPLVAESSMEFYNLTLRKYRDGEISFDDIVKNPAEYIRTWSLWVYMFEDMKNKDKESRMKIVDYATYEAREFSTKGNGMSKIHIVNSWESFSEDYTMKALLRAENKQDYLFEFAKPYKYYFVTEEDYNAKNIQKISKYVDASTQKLEEKYNEKFEFLGIDGENQVFAPKSNPKLVFQRGFGLGQGDRYLSVLVQSYLTNKVYDLIEEEGMTGQIFPFIMPTDNSYISNSMNELEYNTGEGFDIEYLIENVYEGHYDFSLYYMVDNEESIDYALLQRLMGKIYDIPYNTWNSHDELNNWRRQIFTFIHISTEEDRAILSRLFLAEPITADEFPIRKSMGNLASTMYTVRSDTESFKYLDIYTEAIPFILRTSTDPREKSLDQFIQFNKDKSLFEH